MKKTRMKLCLLMLLAAVQSLQAEAAQGAQKEMRIERARGNSLAAERLLSSDEQLALKEERAEEEKSSGALIAQAPHAERAFGPMVAQRLCSKGYNGSTLELEDGTIWSIRKKDGHVVMQWQARGEGLWGFSQGDDLYITTNKNWFFSKDYDFMIVNAETGESVFANFSQPPYQDAAPSIQTIDYTFGRVALNDGSCWNLSGWDQKVYQMWEPLDPIVVGVNNRWNSMEKPFILINTETGQYARAALLN